MKSNRGIDAILADIMMVLLIVTIMILVTMDIAEQQPPGESAEPVSEQLEAEEEITSVEIPTSEENRSAIENGLIVTLLATHYEIRFNNQTASAGSSSELHEAIHRLAGIQQPKVIVLASPTERFQTVIETLELIDGAVAWGTPEVGLIN